MVRLRLRRVGSKRQPSYRIVVANSRSPRDGRYIEKIGFYNPRTEPATMVLDEARALHWLGNGAQPSDAVRRILENLGTYKRYARLVAGEAVEDLVAEAEAEAAERQVDPRTRRDDIVPVKKVKAEAAPAVAETVAEPVAEAAEETETVAEAEAVEETETAAEAEEEAVEETETAAETEAAEEEAEAPEETAEAEAEAEAETAEDEAAEEEAE